MARLTSAVWSRKQISPCFVFPHFIRATLPSKDPESSEMLDPTLSELSRTLNSVHYRVPHISKPRFDVQSLPEPELQTQSASLPLRKSPATTFRSFLPGCFGVSIGTFFAIAEADSPTSCLLAELCRLDGRLHSLAQLDCLYLSAEGGQFLHRHEPLVGIH